MIDHARERLGAALAESFDEELGRYRRLVPDGAGLRSHAARLRDSAREVAALQPSIPLDARAVVDGSVVRAG